MPCCNYFAKQRIDDIGIKAVRLQKVLIFLFFLQLLGVIISGQGFFSLIFYGLVLWIAFVGAKHRRTGFLRTFYLLHIIGAILAIIFFGFAVGTFFVWKNGVCDDAPASDSKLYIVWQNEQEILNDYVSSGSALEGSSSYVSQLIMPRHNRDNEENENEDEEYSAVYCWEASGKQDSTCSSEKKSIFLGKCEDGTLDMHKAFKSYHKKNGQQFEQVDSSEVPVATHKPKHGGHDGRRHGGHHFAAIPLIIGGIIVAILKLYALILAFKIRKMILAQRRNQSAEIEEGIAMEEPIYFAAPPQVGRDGYVQLNQMAPQVFVTPDGSVQYASFYPQMPTAPNPQPDTSRDEEIARSLQDQQ